MKELTNKQIQILYYIYEYLCEHWYQPTVREIAKEFGNEKPLSTNAVSCFLNALEKKGYIERQWPTKNIMRSRGIILTSKGKGFVITCLDSNKTLFYEGKV